MNLTTSISKVKLPKDYLIDNAGYMNYYAYIVLFLIILFFGIPSLYVAMKCLCCSLVKKLKKCCKNDKFDQSLHEEFT